MQNWSQSSYYVPQGRDRISLLVFSSMTASHDYFCKLLGNASIKRFFCSTFLSKTDSSIIDKWPPIFWLFKKLSENSFDEGKLCFEFLDHLSDVLEKEVKEVYLWSFVGMAGCLLQVPQDRVMTDSEQSWWCSRLGFVVSMRQGFVSCFWC
jgi:hypothetical protein